jgi:hypothetical protein
VVLPIGVARGWDPPTAGLQVPWLIGLLAVSIGLPFFAVSATAPLLQKWFAHTDHPAAGDPYFLYGGSNLGSLRRCSPIRSWWSRRSGCTRRA